MPHTSIDTEAAWTKSGWQGLRATRRFALSAIFVYQLPLLYRHQIGADLRVGLKPFLKAA